MSDTSYIGFDFETGGLDPQVNPILTGYFCALDKDLNILGELELKVAPSGPYLTVDAQALSVNGINMEEHMATALSREEASKQLSAFLEKFGGNGPKTKKPRPLGHNVAFDLGFLQQLLPKAEIDRRLNYGSICTKSIADFLKEVGLFPPEIGNLQSLVKYFEIPQLKAHTAKDDTLMMVGVYGKMIQMVKGSVGGGSGLSIDLLSMLEK